MGKLLAGMVVAAVGSLGGAGVATADDFALALTPNPVRPGGHFSAIVTGCAEGEQVTFSIAFDPAVEAPCVDGVAEVGAEAPDELGGYEVFAIGPQSDARALAILNVTELAHTGSSSSTLMAAVASAAVLSGVGLTTLAARLRRRPR